MYLDRRAGFSSPLDRRVRASWLGEPALPVVTASSPSLRLRQLERRVEPRDITTVIILGILTTIVVLMFLICLLRSLRRRHSEPKFIPTPFLKNLWSKWNVPSSQAAYHPASELDDASTEATSVRRPSRARVTSPGFQSNIAGPQAQSSTSNGVPDRSTSIRSIMTLPPYRVNPANTEQVIGREGERDGVDVVVEMPTEEDLEAMRENEMEALYQIRLARRQQNAEREERRRLRHEARERGDVVALQEIRERARNASNNTLVDELRREHDDLKQQRQRAVSTVQYGDLGVARHDGTRLRANSTESERVGLLSDAASIGALSARSGAMSAQSHRVDRNSIDSDLPSPSRSRASSRADTARLSISIRGGRAGSSPDVVGADIGELDMPPHSPPRYDDVSVDAGRSGATTPQNEPPPDYPGQTGSAQRGAELTAEDERGRRASRRGVDGAPTLPSLRLAGLPQIVIEPSNDRAEHR